MATRGKRRYDLRDPESRTDDQSTIAESAFLEATPASNGDTTIIEIAAVAELPTGREKSVIGHFTEQTAREFRDELDQVLHDL